MIRQRRKDRVLLLVDRKFADEIAILGVRAKLQQILRQVLHGALSNQSFRAEPESANPTVRAHQHNSDGENGRLIQINGGGMRSAWLAPGLGFGLEAS